MSPVDTDIPSTRPYLIRALHEWCSDNGFSPYIAVQVDASVQVPMEFVKNGEIVLNVGVDATSALRLGNDFIEFKARFGGVAREIVVPISHVIAIYARENGQGMAFPAPAAATLSTVKSDAVSDATEPASDTVSRSPLRSVTNEDVADEGDEPPEPPSDGPGRTAGRPQLKRVK
ncbi:ClpXP protease specificity-enhancing factor [Hydrogenophaga sp. PBL-H3]|uniref:ClpXP protease specificity-enhancing factor n=1 Tax=Hydrogenophaga sp. PBL-H3 TaxID=434010 RepID=UPI0013203660|nr:ClpXP protease specificity-enhancing factor [Hydrogenophaga sp. PBL-H3]QHE77546.1 ClpXP protease specificity-enhancing factor [Hydrogenophaga sp. PBL-H3]QHE81970.1 ClpXP protease specificity-enhancing factor [Hydrogenophaga sp. PBL-H3]